MNDYRLGYEHYKKACMRHGLEPINFHFFILNLSEEQLEQYNASAFVRLKGGTNEYAVVS